jgi:hypothetical protein
MVSNDAMDWFPELPDVPASQRAIAESQLRYEDVTQDGRLQLWTLTQSIGDVIWRKLLSDHPIALAARQGTVPILSRIVLEGGAGPISVGRPVDGAGRYQLARTETAGKVERILLNMWTTVTAAAARTSGPPPPNVGEPLLAGRAFAEHVITRLFAPPEERKVTALDMAGLERVPAALVENRPLEAALLPPEGAVWLDGELVEDPAPIAFGLNHTDSNHHVHSIVYPRLFHDAALRRFAAHGRSTAVLARRLEVVYRKPTFAGQVARIRLRAYQLGESLGAVGALVSDVAPLERPHCALQLRFVP